MLSGGNPLEMCGLFKYTTMKIPAKFKKVSGILNIKHFRFEIQPLIFKLVEFYCSLKYCHQNYQTKTSLSKLLNLNELVKIFKLFHLMN